jgi:hypothetical protein
MTRLPLTIDDQGAVRLECKVESEIEEIAARMRSVDGEIEDLAQETGNLMPWQATRDSRGRFPRESSVAP